MSLGRSKPTKKWNDPTYDYISKVLSYSPETGDLFNQSGAKIGYKCKDGYIQITLPDGSQRKAHRLIWLLMTGENPTNLIDHKDGDKTNNRWSNLREATFSQNAMNGKFRKSNTSGYKGVSWDKRYQKWESYIWKEHRKYHLGYFDDELSAAKAYKGAVRDMHGEFVRENAA